MFGFKKNKNGFTLIELLVVISIIGLLSSIVMASLSNAKMKARDARRIQDLKQIQIALEMYRNTNGKYPIVNVVSGQPKWVFSYNNWSGSGGTPKLQDELRPYINQLPKDPINSSGDPWNNSEAYNYAYISGESHNPNYKCFDGSCYDLVAKLEDPSSPYRCEIKQYKWNAYNTVYCPQNGGFPNFTDPNRLYSVQN